jgi:hypothetical protein
MLRGGCPTRVSKEAPAASCSALPQAGDRIGSSLRLGSRQSSWLTRTDLAVGSTPDLAFQPPRSAPTSYGHAAARAYVKVVPQGDICSSKLHFIRPPHRRSFA